MNQNYEKIKRACQIANPRLLELSFGCEVLMDDGKTWTVYETTGDSVGLIRNAHDRRFPCKSQIQEILGHEPTIQDIFLAISEKLKAEDMYYTFTIEVCDILELYDLTKPVKDQSEKTLQFIADLL